jgi:hypothetical protein
MLYRTEMLKIGQNRKGPIYSRYLRRNILSRDSRNEVFRRQTATGKTHSASFTRNMGKQ